MAEGKYVVTTKTTFPQKEARVLYFQQVAISQSCAVTATVTLTIAATTHVATTIAAAAAATTATAVIAFEFWLKHLYLWAESPCNGKESF